MGKKGIKVRFTYGLEYLNGSCLMLPVEDQKQNLYIPTSEYVSLGYDVEKSNEAVAKSDIYTGIISETNTKINMIPYDIFITTSINIPRAVFPAIVGEHIIEGLNGSNEAELTEAGFYFDSENNLNWDDNVYRSINNEAYWSKLLVDYVYNILDTKDYGLLELKRSFNEFTIDYAEYEMSAFNIAATIVNFNCLPEELLEAKQLIKDALIYVGNPQQYSFILYGLITHDVSVFFLAIQLLERYFINTKLDKKVLAKYILHSEKQTTVKEVAPSFNASKFFNKRNRRTRRNKGFGSN